MSDQREVRAAVDELRSALTDLTEARKVKVVGADNSVQWGLLQSLWSQAQEAISASSNQGARSSRDPFRLPYDADIADYLNDVRQIIAKEIRSRRLEPRRDPMADLRQIIECDVAAGDLNRLRLRTWTIGEWVSYLRRHLDLDDAKPARPIRDATCPNCGFARIRREDDPGGAGRQPTYVVQPALVIPDPGVPAATCLACTRTWDTTEELSDLGYDIDAMRAAQPRPKSETAA